MRYFVSGLALTAVLAVAVVNVQMDDSQAQQQVAVVKAPALKLGDPLPANLYVELAKAINPAIVNISTLARPRQSMRRDPFWDELERFYGIPAPRGSSKPMPLSLGTGFIIREDGLIVTNAHVVRMADLIDVQLEEGSDKTYRAEVIGSDARADIALLKIKADKKLTPVALGSSADTEVGEWVAAFGNPFGHGHSVTKGIISSKGRSLGEINPFPLLQTDAAINPGNSGGPLVNSKGLVIGVNVAIDARAQGIGFAIPIDEVKRMVPELEKRGHLVKGYIGVVPADIVSRDESESVGAGVVSVEPGGPAQKAGLKYGDVIVEFNGKKVSGSMDLIDVVASTAPGTNASMKVLRQEGAKQRTLNLKIKVTERDDARLLGRRGSERSMPEGREVPNGFGFSVADLTDKLRGDLGLPKDVKKPIITEVEPNSMAAFVGLQQGDVLLEVNRNEVKTAKEAIGKMKKGENTLKVARGNRIIIISINR